MGSLPINRQGESLTCAVVVSLLQTEQVCSALGSARERELTLTHVEHATAPAHVTGPWDQQKSVCCWCQNLILNLSCSSLTFRFKLKILLCTTPLGIKWLYSQHSKLKMEHSNSSKAKHRFIFLRQSSFRNLSFSSTVKSLSPVIMILTEKYLRMLKRKPSDKQVTSPMFAAEHHKWLC